MIFGIDFDGTIVEHDYPEIGRANPHAIRVMNKLVENGHKIVLNTMRSGEELRDAVEYIESHGIVLHGINHNPDQDSWTSSPKVYANRYIDDAALGCPLRDSFQVDRQMVDWIAIDMMLLQMGVYK